LVSATEVAVITAVPTATAVTSPVADTVATASAEELHVTFASEPDGTAVTESCLVAVGASVKLPPSMVIEVGALRDFTSNVMLALTVETVVDVAVTVTVPAVLVAVTMPAALTVAESVLLLLHVTAALAVAGVGVMPSDIVLP